MDVFGKQAGGVFAEFVGSTCPEGIVWCIIY